MTIITKSVISISTIGALSAIGLYAGGLFNTKKIERKSTYRDKLLSEGFDLDINGRGWMEILIKYNAKKDTKTTFKTNADDIEIENGLIQKCKDFWNKKESDEVDYKKLKRWCVKEEAINDILSRARYKKIDTESTDDAVLKKWESKTEKLKLNKDSFPVIGAKMGNIKNTNIDELKKWCKDLNSDTLKTTEDNFIQKFENARDWCYLKENLESELGAQL